MINTKNLTFSILGMILVLSIFWVGSVSAHRSPKGCSGSGLQISLFTNAPQAHIGDNISYSLTVFNGPSANGTVLCDATNIQASLVTPDNITHPIALLRTALSDGQSDNYPNVVTYIARAADIKSDGSLKATASDTGVIHQNDTDSQGGANQGLNVTVLNSPAPTSTQTSTPTPTQTPVSTPTPAIIPVVVQVSTPIPPTTSFGGGGGGGSYTGYTSPSPTITPTQSSVVSSATPIPAVASVLYFPNAGLPPKPQNFWDMVATFLWQALLK